MVYFILTILLTSGLIATYLYTHKDRRYLNRHAKRLGIQPKRFETDRHLRERILEKLRNR